MRKPLSLLQVVLTVPALAGLFGCVSVTRPSIQSPPVTLGRAVFHLNADRTPDVLSLIWVNGRHYMDDVPWCGEGEKYEGQFIFRVQLGHGRIVDTPLDSINAPFQFFFVAENQPWPIYIADYNHDGQLDFNIVSYGSCSHDLCGLFTVLPSGKIERLKIEPGNDDLVIERQDRSVHSTKEFQLTPSGFCYTTWFFGEDYLENVDWDAKQKLFRCHEHKIKPPQ
jgi:hypothetical protein